MLKRIWEQRGISLAMRFVFRFLDYLWPKDHNLVAVSGGRGLGFADNSRFLFERFIDVYRGEFTFLWITPSKEQLCDSCVKEEIRDCMVYQYSIKGLLSLLRARTLFFCWGSSDLLGTDFSRRTVVIQLWHGIPIKRIGIYSRQLGRGWGHRASAVRAYSKFDYWICSSRIDRNSIALCTGLSIDNVRITGLPRNDYLIEHKNAGDREVLKRFPFLDKLTILYAPTYRSKGKVEFFPFDDFDIQKMKTFLEERDAYLLLRTHYVDEVATARNRPVDLQHFGCDRIVVLNRDAILDVQEILPFVDIMISDYSGIWVDFLLLDKPIIFIPYDLSAYEKADGLLYDYDFITPGPKALRFNDLLTELDQYLSDPEKDSSERASIRHLFHEYEDGKAHQRLYQLVKEVSSGNH